LRSAALHGQYKVLVVADLSRCSRDAEVALRIRRELRAAGVTLNFADEGFLSTDENARERYLDEQTRPRSSSPHRGDDALCRLSRGRTGT